MAVMCICRCCTWALNLVIPVATRCSWITVNGKKILVDFGMQIFCGR